MLLERLGGRARDELEVELPFETGTPREALRAAAAWKPGPGSASP